MVDFIYLISAILFILSLRNLSTIKTARIGNIYAILGITLAILATIYTNTNIKIVIVLFTICLGGTIGFLIARKINMKDLPQLVAAFHSLIGLSAICLDTVIFLYPDIFYIEESVISRLEVALGITIGAITFTGSIVAFGKLQGIIRKTWFLKNINIILSIALFIFIINFIKFPSIILFTTILLISLLIGWFLIIPIGGADMPVIVSMLNSYSGWAAAGIGITLNNQLLIIVGALVGTSGAILSHIMCKGMNRSLVNVIFKGFVKNNKDKCLVEDKIKNNNINICGIEDASYLLSNANNVIIVPGYGMAVSQAQHALKELFDKLTKQKISVKFAIHPVAGRMPGHMNVLLAEANINDDNVYDLDDINSEFSTTDVVLVVGANDITNPGAKDDPNSPIYGMPILEVWNAKTVIVIKRSLNTGYAGIENNLFYRNNTLMLLGDAKKVIKEINKI